VSEVNVVLTRTELVALKETIELTPGFQGRTQVRDAIQRLLRLRRPSPLCVEEHAIAELARRIVPVDVQAAILRSKLEHAIAEYGRRTGTPPRRVAFAQPE
jgi:hypothetical protein